MNVNEVLKWLEEESDRLTEESLSSADPHKTVNNSFLEGFNYALANVQGLEQPQLNDDQQAVLEWLKWKRHEGSQPIECLSALAFGNAIKLAIIAYINLKDTQQFQVLAAFAEWGMEQEEE